MTWYLQRVGSLVGKTKARIRTAFPPKVGLNLQEVSWHGLDHQHRCLLGKENQDGVLKDISYSILGFPHLPETWDRSSVLLDRCHNEGVFSWFPSTTIKASCPMSSAGMCHHKLQNNAYRIKKYIRIDTPSHRSYGGRYSCSSLAIDCPNIEWPRRRTHCEQDLGGFWVSGYPINICS